MDLNFESQGGYFIAEFEVTSDFNLHIEKDPIGEFLVYQRTAGGQYDLIQNFKKDKGDDSIIDYDFQALVYPKWIKIKSSVKPLVAIVTMEANEDIPEEGGETIEPEDLLYYMDGTFDWNEGFVVNLNTGEAVLEALVEFTTGGITMTSEGDGVTEGDTGSKDPGTSEGEGEGNGEGTPEDGEGGKKKDPVEPPVIWPPIGI